MGDRATIEIVQEAGAVGRPERVISLYTHWGGSSYAGDLAAALAAARPRWRDPLYATRIITDQFFKNLRDEETGGGLYGGRCVTECEHPLLTVCLPTRTVTVGSAGWGDHGRTGSVYSFDDFIANVGGILDAL